MLEAAAIAGELCSLNFLRNNMVDIFLLIFGEIFDKKFSKNRNDLGRVYRFFWIVLLLLIGIFLLWVYFN